MNLEQSKIQKNYSIILLCFSASLLCIGLFALTIDSLHNSYLDRQEKKIKELNINYKLIKEIE